MTPRLFFIRNYGEQAARLHAAHKSKMPDAPKPSNPPVTCAAAVSFWATFQSEYISLRSKCRGCGARAGGEY